MPTWTFFDSYKTTMIEGPAADQIDLDTQLIKVALVTNGNPPDANVDDNWDDLQATEVSGGGYTARGEALATRTITETTGTVTFDADDVTWVSNGTGFTDARHAILYFDSAVDATSNLIATLNLGVDKRNTTGDFTLQMDTLGIITLTG